MANDSSESGTIQYIRFRAGSRKTLPRIPLNALIHLVPFMTMRTDIRVLIVK